MSELPLLFLPKPGAPLRRQTRRVFFGEHYRLPSRAEASAKFTKKFESISETLVTENPEAISPENVLVLETVGRVEEFQRAASRIVGLNWQGEFDVDDIQSDEDFFEHPKIGSDFFKDRVFGFARDDSKILNQTFQEFGIIDEQGYLNDAATNEDIAKAIPEEYEQNVNDILSAVDDAKKKNLSGRLYLSLSNRQALEQVKRLFDLWKNNEDPPELTSVWKNLFDHLHDVRFWEVEDRLRDTGIIDYWEKEVDLKRGTADKIVFEVELAFTNLERERTERAERITELTREQGGVVIASCHIPEIRFQALKVELPVDSVERFLRGEYSSLLTNGGVLFFRPVPQSNLVHPHEGEITEIEHREAPANNPKVALLDGMPLSNHSLLDGYLVVDDPDDLSNKYNPTEFRHGTAMASLICHGELDSDSPSLNCKLYVRPILSPGENGYESFPKNIFFEDVIERSLRRMFEGEGGEPPSAPTVKIINLSVADPARAFHYAPSSIARLLDWLSYKYDVLFCVSSGNIQSDMDLGLDDRAFVELSPGEQISLTLQSINGEKRNRRIFAPAESLNALSVGALHSDEAPDVPFGNRIDLIPDNNLLSPISTLGHGFRAGIKPEIFMSGGRQLYDYIGEGVYSISEVPQAPGQRVAAAPVHPGEISRTTYTRGTSNATALATRSAVLLHDNLEALFDDAGEKLPNNGVTPLLKALLVHSASWGEQVDLYSSVLELRGQQRRKEVARFLGYGVPNIHRVLSCTESRATAIGFGSIQKDERHEFSFPLPQSLSGSGCWRKLTVTLSWNTPVNSDNRKYRRAALSFEPKDLKNNIGGQATEADHRQVRNSTVQHEVIEGKEVKTYIEGDALVVAVQCREDAGPLDGQVPYALAVSLEVKEEVGLPIYEEIRQAIEITIQARVEERV